MSMPLTAADIQGMCLAGMYFDAEHASAARLDGIPEEPIQRLRYDHGRGCLASPDAMAQLAEWRAGYDIPEGHCQTCGHAMTDHDHDGCTVGCIRPTVDQLAGCLCGEGGR